MTLERDLRRQRFLRPLSAPFREFIALLITSELMAIL